MDETNPDRVSILEYARQIGRAHVTVLDMVNGYAEWAGRGAPTSEFRDYQARAKLRGDDVAATEAAAQARGISLEAASETACRRGRVGSPGLRIRT